MIKRFVLNEDNLLIDKETGQSYSSLEECVVLLNSINHEKIDSKRQLNNLKYRINQLII